MNFSSMPEILRTRPQWVCWQWGRPRPGEAKRPKIPITPRTGEYASASDPATWGTFTEALDRYYGGGYQGISLALGDGITGIDLDACLDDAGTLTAFAETIVNELWSYTAYSHSGRGVHILCLGEKPGPRCRYGDTLEMYSERRFLALTGEVVPGAAVAVAERSEALERLYQRLWPDTPAARRSRAHSGPLDDDDLFRIAMKSANFRALWFGNTGRFDHNASRADYAFCLSLAGLTRDAGQIDRLYRHSALYRPKWDARRPSAGTYGGMTIEAALRRVGA